MQLLTSVSLSPHSPLALLRSILRFSPVCDFLLSLIGGPALRSSCLVCTCDLGDLSNLTSIIPNWSIRSIPFPLILLLYNAACVADRQWFDAAGLQLACVANRQWCWCCCCDSVIAPHPLTLTKSVPLTHSISLWALINWKFWSIAFGLVCSFPIFLLPLEPQQYLVNVKTRTSRHIYILAANLNNASCIMV